MINTIRYIDDENGNHVFPVTHERAVRDSNGITLDTKLATFITASANNLVNYYLKSETYTKSETDALLAAVKQFSYVVADSLPTASASTLYKIYLIPSEDPQTLNVKDEYITVESSGSYSWEQIGSTAVDLSGYVTTTDLNTALASYVTSTSLNTALAAKQDTLVSGTNLKTVNSTSLLGSGNIVISDGKSAYQSWLDAGHTGTESDFLNWLKGVGFQSVSSQQDGTIVITLTNGDTVTVDLNHNHPQYISKAAETAQPSGGFAPDVVYKLGTLTGTVTFSLAASVSGNVNHYFWTFDTDSTAPTVTWPSGITWADGTGPTVAASKHYEISILDGIAAFTEV